MSDYGDDVAGDGAHKEKMLSKSLSPFYYQASRLPVYDLVVNHVHFIDGVNASYPHSSDHSSHLDQ